MTASTISTSEAAAKLDQFQREGYCVLKEMADDALLQRTRECVERAVATQDIERLTRTRSPGTLIDSDAHPELAGIIGTPTALKALDEIGLPYSKFWKAVIISKPPGGPRLY